MKRQLMTANFDGIVKEVSVSDFTEALNLEVLWEGKGYMDLSTVNVCRPGLQLSGYFYYFGENRIQVMGNAEMFYYDQMDRYERVIRMEQIVRLKIPCVIIARDLHVPQDLFDLLKLNNIPFFRSKLETSQFINELMIYLNLCLAPETTEHGVLLDVYGVGVMLTGKSGIGKSETALELVKRGHRLVADDSVIIKRVQDKLIGTSSETIRYFMEIRGIGIIDVRSVYGVGSVLHDKEVSLVVEMEHWDSQREYDRLGQERFTQECLGLEIPKLIIPITPGRNLPIIMEVAAKNHRLRDYGYDATKVLIERALGGQTTSY
ncbi:MAG: HPr(Ser) kinase/phosphatase [Bacillota bacterium]